MKLIRNYLLALALFFCSAVTAQNFTINGSVNGIPDGTILELVIDGRHLDEKPIATTIVTNGEFKFSERADEPMQFGVRPKGQYNLFSIVLAKENIAEVSFNAAQRGENYTVTNLKITGSPLQTEFESIIKVKETFNAQYEANSKKHSAVIAKINAVQEGSDAMKEIQNSTEWKALEEDDKNFLEKVEGAYKKAIYENRNSWIGPLLAVNLYSYFTPDQAYLYDDLSAEAKESYYGNVLNKLIHPAAFIGKQFPLLEAKDRNGKAVDFKTIAKNKKYILIDFWASWCAPCRKAIPELKTAYEELKDKGFEIISISTDKKEADWIKADEQEKLPWPSFLDNNSNTSNAWNVSAIPAVFLLDGNGTVIAEQTNLKAILKMVTQGKSNDLPANASTYDAQRALAETKVYALLKSNKEEDWNTAINKFYDLKKQMTVDSIKKAVRVKFPLGIAVRSDELQKIYDEKEPAKKEAVYKEWIKKFPPEKMGKDRIVYDYARHNVGRSYALADNVKKAIEYANMIETGGWKGEGYSSIAKVLLQNGHLNEAAELFRKATAVSYNYVLMKEKDNEAQFASKSYPYYCGNLADVLYKQKKYEEALKYSKEAYKLIKPASASISTIQAKILMELNKNQEAFDVIKEVIAEGQGTDEMKAMLKPLYAKMKGSADGFDDFMALQNKIAVEKIRSELAAKLINKPAANFILKDLDGKEVSLSDYKGKTVILDFWATWCGPCKKSFPAMQKAINKYKNDTSVKFLFIHTWEKKENATKEAREYIQSNNYNFEVLMDLKDPVTANNKVVESYNVTGIPAKFVIDKKGNIRFAITGISGSDDAIVEELSAMIELANKE